MKLSNKIAITLLAIGLIGLVSFQIKKNDRYFEIIKNLDVFTTLYKELNTYYVDEINPTDIMETGIEAMLESLDPYTNFIPEDKIEDYRIMSTGQYAGIGTTMGKIEDRHVVMMIFEGAPAETSGVNIGDELLEINNNPVDDYTTEEINKLLKGQIGTTVEIKINRKGIKKPLNFSINRESINVESVPYYGLIAEDIAYIRLTEFSSGAGASVRSALVELKGKGAKKVILDLRGNPGGLLNESIEVSNVFIPKGLEVVSTKGKIEEWNKTYTANKNPVDVNIPVAVLISNNSASASEIVAGVMQDYDRGILVGQRSYGKGLVQATRPLSYNSQLKITTAKYYIPSGRCIQAIDYSHRNEDGSIGKIPDSLKSEFKTRAGRIVYDGGGVSPDHSVINKGYAPITIQLIRKGFIFDFATEYYYKNVNSKPDPREFSVSDDLYNEFTTWVSGKDYSYTTATEETIKELRETADSDKYFDFLEKEIMVLEKEIQEHKKEDLKVFQSEIKRALKEEIISRYHKRQGMIESSFENDEEVDEAIKLLNDEAQYKALLQVDK
ncbi:S41 family peptidase [Marivirga salinae]|uniref:S41 family peptidase n=1 Tax=Marivirga salinarum TaxID=3059078 RepID=A0AA51NB27_9BACT|nr:S41 family peptidase [Marivirga sp. BDSF4-3]WMN11863.1 S41 family peptidase [Marivirga sp. BDSF4-3]